MHAYRTHNCGQLRAEDVGQNVRVSGWVHRKRDHGGLLFVDLRDHYGLTQIVADSSDAAFATLDGLRAESVVTITGDVVARSAETVNRSEEHTSELQSLMRISYAVFCLKKKKTTTQHKLPLTMNKNKHDRKTI